MRGRIGEGVRGRIGDGVRVRIGEGVRGRAGMPRTWSQRTCAGWREPYEQWQGSTIESERLGGRRAVQRWKDVWWHDTCNVSVSKFGWTPGSMDPQATPPPGLTAADGVTSYAAIHHTTQRLR